MCASKKRRSRSRPASGCRRWSPSPSARPLPACSSSTTSSGAALSTTTSRAGLRRRGSCRPRRSISFAKACFPSRRVRRRWRARNSSTSGDGATTCRPRSIGYVAIATSTAPWGPSASAWVEHRRCSWPRDGRISTRRSRTTASRPTHAPRSHPSRWRRRCTARSSATGAIRTRA